MFFSLILQNKELKKNLLIKKDRVIVIEEPKNAKIEPQNLLNKIPESMDKGAIVRKTNEKTKYNPKIDKKIQKGCCKINFSFNSSNLSILVNFSKSKIMKIEITIIIKIINKNILYCFFNRNNLVF